MTDNETRGTRDAIDIAIGEVLFNARNFPERVQPYILGQDMAPLRKKLVAAVINAVLIPADTAALITEARETQAFIDEREALKYGSVVGESNRLTERLADALESSSREVERLRMALKEKEEA